MSQGCAFLVARGRRTVYRTALAPGFLVDADLQHLLAQESGTTAGRSRLTEAGDSRTGVFSIGYRSEQLADGALDAEGSEGVGALTDEHGRPLEIIYGIVARDALEEPLDAEDLQTARTQALQTYARFLADETAHRVESSEPFSLRTRGHERPAPRSHFAATPRPPQNAMRRSGVARKRPFQVAALAAAAVLIGTGVLIGPLSGDDEGRKVVTAAWSDERPTGAVRLCGVEGGSGSQRRAVGDYHRRFAGARVALVESPRDADDARPDPDVGRLAGGSGACDVLSLDVIYMAELASKDLLYDMTPYLRARDRGDGFNAQMIETARYDGKLWGVPKQLDVGVLYYRADRVRAPTSWQDVYRQSKPQGASERPGLRLQAGTGEGLTVVLLELAYAAGARPIVSADGKAAAIDQPQVLEALRFLRNAVRDGVIPAGQPSAEGSLFAYEVGRASFLRGWPSAAARIETDAGRGETRPARRTTAENTDIAALPPWEAGGRRVAVLGGRNLVIPRSARNPSAALHLIDYLTSEAQVRRDERDSAQIPVLTAVADAPDLTHRELLSEVRRTHVLLRPVLPQYAAVSRIISAGVKATLAGPADGTFAREKVQEMEREVQRLLER
ncbi:MAG: extracellular solute-binding protein [Chloroflexi bacterium]|nr:extracellular solute-binding protein [Chloroflexota bacterium]